MIASAKDTWRRREGGTRRANDIVAAKEVVRRLLLFVSGERSAVKRGWLFSWVFFVW